MPMLWKKQKRIYMDYAATTPVDAQVLKAMMPYFADDFGNANSIHLEGVKARVALDNARKSVASILNTRDEEIIFTSGGTESNSLAIFSAINSFIEAGKDIKDLHAITSVIEHPSVLDVFKTLEKKGLEVSYVGVDESGVVKSKDVRDAMKENTILVSIMYVNNEIGAIQPISKISKIIRYEKKRRKKLSTFNFQTLYFHTDASQAPLYLPLNTLKLGVDMLTLGGQKMYGPKGVGCLFKKKDVKLNLPRSGTENIPLIVGFSYALELAEKNRESETERVVKLRDYFISELKENIPQIKLNGSHKERVANNVNIYISNIDGEFFTLILDNKGIACSTKSACKVDHNDEEGSYVIQALGYSKERAKSSLRFSLGKDTTKKDIIYAVKILKESVERYSN
jgi:cysteine desulfurase